MERGGGKRKGRRGEPKEQTKLMVAGQITGHMLLRGSRGAGKRGGRPGLGDDETPPIWLEAPSEPPQERKQGEKKKENH